MELSIERKVELLELVKYNLKQNIDNTYCSGICQIVTYLGMTNDVTRLEREMLLSYIKANKPTKTNGFSRFTKDVLWQGEQPHWWCEISVNPRTLKPRLEFIDALIKSLSKI